jgi:hypothetical protein
MFTSGSHDHNEKNRSSSGAAGILTEEQKRVVDDVGDHNWSSWKQ